MQTDFDKLSRDEVDIEMMNAFHLSGNLYGVSLQLSDKYNEIARSFIFIVEFGQTLACREILRLENLLLDHISFAEKQHIALQIGGISHHLSASESKQLFGPEPFTNKLWRLDAKHIFLFGEAGTVCRLQENEWQPIKPATTEFLRSMSGCGPDTIIAAGDRGTLLRLENESWTQVDLQVNQSITASHVSTDGATSLGCEDGDCFQLLDDELIILQTEGGKFMSICEFRGQIFWGDDEYGLYQQNGRKLEPCRALEFAYAMHATETRLVVTGWKEVFIFDGDNWRGFEFAYDGNVLLREVDMLKRYTD